MGAFPSPLTTPPPGPLRRRIPYDYSFFFEMTGAPQKVLASTVTVSVEASFVAASVGYGFVPVTEPLRFGGKRADFLPAVSTPPVTAAFVSTTPVLSAASIFGPILNVAAKSFKEPVKTAEFGPLTAQILESGFRINPALAQRILNGGLFEPIEDALLEQLFEVVTPPPDQIQFLYALFDQGTGRAFQSEPLLNTAGLGDSRGERPFRHFASPIVFAPRTVIKMEVTELTTIKGSLYVSLHGYKVLGGVGTPTGPSGPVPVSPASAAGTAGPVRQRRRRRPS